MRSKGRSNTIRIIGGEHRGRKLRFPDVKGLRPTADRVRETLFNWLQTRVPGAVCLDLFAGSGAIGLEALSRGADKLVFCEQSAAAVHNLQENIELLGLQDKAEVQRMDARRLLQRSPGELFDIVFLDPPFAAGLLSEICQQLEQSGCLAQHAFIYVEQDSSHPWPDLPPGWQLYRETAAGQAACRLFQRVILRGRIVE
jgi:16S rRNA (guanine966-N2)-methyltransferase